ncbi:MAG TPA: acyl-CoA dehydrogenase family protein [Burkholderiaceae bacterium]|nr:acyl-CoA dehydrogenase family protein [Burkholderiaceae bacterium]
MQDVLDSVKRFAAGEIEPRAAEVDRSGQLPHGLVASLGEQGLLGLAVPARWGGIDSDLATFGACLEIVGRACASTAWVLLAHSMSARAIVAAGSDAQKERWLPELASGRRLGSAMAGTEAGGGSNPLGIRTAARRNGENWVLEGGKEFISLAGLADLYVVMARTAEPPASLGCFVVEKADSGLSFGRREELLGVRGVPVGGFALSGCTLPADRLLGAEAGGLMVMGAISAWGLVGAASAALGIASAALGAAVAHLSERVVAGARLASLAGVQATVGDLQMQLAGARAGLAQAIRDIEGCKGPPLPLFMAKLAATETAVCVVDRCMALHGAAGYSRELPAERRMRDVRAFTIHWANNEVLRDTIRKGSLA